MSLLTLFSGLLSRSCIHTDQRAATRLTVDADGLAAITTRNAAATLLTTDARAATTITTRARDATTITITAECCT